jgi:hypothetical protein
VKKVICHFFQGHTSRDRGESQRRCEFSATEINTTTQLGT